MLDVNGIARAASAREARMVTVEVDRNLLGQLLESAEARAEQYDETARVLDGYNSDDTVILEVNDADEARSIAAFIRQGINAVRSQL